MHRTSSPDSVQRGWIQETISPKQKGHCIRINSSGHSNIEAV